MEYDANDYLHWKKKCAVQINFKQCSQSAANMGIITFVGLCKTYFINCYKSMNEAEKLWKKNLA